MGPIAIARRIRAHRHDLEKAHESPNLDHQAIRHDGRRRVDRKRARLRLGRRGCSAARSLSKEPIPLVLGPEKPLDRGCHVESAQHFLLTIQPLSPGFPPNRSSFN